MSEGFTFGERDGFVVVDVPDAETAAAAAIAVNSTGAFRSIRTVELVEPERLGEILGKAGGLVGGYRAPDGCGLHGRMGPWSPVS